MSSETALQQKIRQVIANQLSVDVSKVVDSARFSEDLSADSLDTVELVMAFEEEFGCEIPDTQAEKLLTVADAIAYIEKHAKSA